MSKSIAVFGVGPGLGQAVARRYGREGYEVVLIARRPDPLDRFAQELSGEGIAAHVVTADLSQTDSVPTLAEQIRGKAGHLSALYYGPTMDPPGVSAISLTPEELQQRMPMTLYTLLALVQEFLPPMLEEGDGAILSAGGAAALQGWAHTSGHAPPMAAQRHYLQSLSAAVADQGVYVGMLHIGARILGTPFDEQFQEAQARGEPVPDMPAVEPAELADLVWSMHADQTSLETVVPEGLLDT